MHVDVQVFETSRAALFDVVQVHQHGRASLVPLLRGDGHRERVLVRLEILAARVVRHLRKLKRPLFLASLWRSERVGILAQTLHRGQ